MPAVYWPCFVAICAVLSSCSNASESMSGGFRTPDQNGLIPTDLVETQSAVVENTVSVVAGRSEGNGLRAYAGIIPNQPEQLPLSGEAIFRGPYAIAFIEDILIEDDFVTGRNSRIDGIVTLETDLSEMTLTGTDGILTLRAQIVDNAKIAGEVDVLGVPGVFEGEIGADRAFGVFHGGDLTHLMSGGVVADRIP